MDEVEANRYAIVAAGQVVNIVLWDGDAETWAPPEGAIAVLCPDHVGIGWGYADGEWIAPPSDEVQP